MGPYCGPFLFLVGLPQFIPTLWSGRLCTVARSACGSCFVFVDTGQCPVSDKPQQNSRDKAVPLSLQQPVQRCNGCWLLVSPAGVSSRFIGAGESSAALRRTGGGCIRLFAFTAVRRQSSAVCFFVIQQNIFTFSASNLRAPA